MEVGISQFVKVSESHKEVYHIEDEIAVVRRVHKKGRYPLPVNILSLPTKRSMNAGFSDLLIEERLESRRLEIAILSDLDLLPVEILVVLGMEPLSKNLVAIKFMCSSDV